MTESQYRKIWKARDRKLTPLTIVPSSCYSSKAGLSLLGREFPLKSRSLKRTCFAAAAVLFAVANSGCSIKQSVKPVDFSGQPMEVCILKNEDVREGFLEAYTSALNAKSVQVKLLPETASLNECPTTSTYTARWAWDLALYMKYAEIKVYRSAALIGEAVYDATWGGGRLDKFINAENKIRELVHELFSTRQARVLATGLKVEPAPD
jgi:hypothetical protein